MKVFFLFDRTLKGHTSAVKYYYESATLANLQAEMIGVDPEYWRHSGDTLRQKTEGSIVVQCFVPSMLKRLNKCRNFAIVFHEWSKFPTKWKRSIDEFDGLIAPSRYVFDILKNFVEKASLSYIPVPLSVQSFKQRTQWTAMQPFRFLSVGEWHFRKGFHLLIEAFGRAFNDNPNYELWIKSGNLSSEYHPECKNVNIDSRTLTEVEVTQFYSQFDAYVCGSLAEGFGLPVAEAMASKVPVIAPAWAGLTEFCGSRTCFQVDFSVQLQPFWSKMEYYAPGQQCSIISLEDCAEMMRYVANTTTMERASVASRGFARIRDHLSPARVAQQLADFILDKPR